jgi:hypothetical protein
MGRLSAQPSVWADADSGNLLKAAHVEAMNASSHTTVLRPRRRRSRLVETIDGPGGPGRVVERWMLMWRWETWASESALARRPRGGWALTYRQALIASQDALDDYELVDVAA